MGTKVKRQYYSPESDGFYGAFYACPSSSEKAMILMLGDAIDDRMAISGVKWLQNYSMIDGRMNNMPPKGPVHRRLARKRRKGKLPMKGRESVLKRLKEYQDELAAQKGQAVMNQDAPELQERKKA